MSKGRRLTPRERAGIVAAYKAGVDYKDIAAEFSVAPSTVYYFASLAGVRKQEDDDWFDRPPWERMQSFCNGYNEGNEEFLR